MSEWPGEFYAYIAHIVVGTERQEVRRSYTQFLEALVWNTSQGDINKQKNNYHFYYHLEV